MRDIERHGRLTFEVLDLSAEDEWESQTRSMAWRISSRRGSYCRVKSSKGTGMEATSNV
jgi:hypothetical protein